MVHIPNHLCRVLDVFRFTQFPNSNIQLLKKPSHLLTLANPALGPGYLGSRAESATSPAPSAIERSLAPGVGGFTDERLLAPG